MSYSNELPHQKARPVSAAERYLCLDVLRGVAVLGILVMNIYAFAMPAAAYSNPLLMGGTDALNLGIWIGTHILADQKFYSIFSMLFGAGVILMMDRTEKRGAAFGPVYYRRNFWLLLMGLLHAYFIWFGDVLFYYALIGMIVFLFRNISPKRLIVTACLLMLVPPLINFGSSFAVEKLQAQALQIKSRIEAGEQPDDAQQEILEKWEKAEPFMFPTEESLAETVAAYRGGYREALEERASTAAMMQRQWLPTFAIWRFGGLMLLGMALMKLGIISGERNIDFYKRLAMIAYGIGLPLAAFSAADRFAHEFDPIHYLRYGNIANYVAAVFVALGHLAAVNLIVKSGIIKWLVGRFGAVGRMALTNYLMHSVVMTLIFYGYGLGLFGDVPRLWQQVLVLALISVQLLISPWWLKHYRFGPVEWLWRSLSYWERQPMRQ